MIQSWSKVSPNITSQWSNPDPKWAQILHHNDPILIQSEPKYYMTMIQSWSKVSPNITSQWSNPDPKWAQILHDNDPILILSEPKYYMTMIQIPVFVRSSKHKSHRQLNHTVLVTNCQKYRYKVFNTITKTCILQFSL